MRPLKSVYKAIAALSLTAAVGSSTACGTDSCNTGQVVSCACLGGEEGLQQCRADGTFDRCLCGDELADAGLRTDAGTPPDTPDECEWDVSLDTWGGFVQLEGGDMGLIDWSEGTIWRIPCDGSPPFQALTDFDPDGGFMRRMPDGRYFFGRKLIGGTAISSRGTFLAPDLTVTQGLPEPSGGAILADDRAHIFEIEGTPTAEEKCLVDHDPSGREVGRACSSDVSSYVMMAPLEHGTVVFGNSTDDHLLCWAGGSTSPVRMPLPVDRSDFSPLSPDNVIPARGDRFFVRAHVGNDAFIHALDCEGTHYWTIAARSSSGSGLTQAPSGARWTGDGDLFYFQNAVGGSLSLAGTSGWHLIGLFSAETGEARWVRSLDEQLIATPGPNDTIWVNSLDVGITVLDGDGNHLLGSPLP